MTLMVGGWGCRERRDGAGSEEVVLPGFPNMSSAPRSAGRLRPYINPMNHILGIDRVMLFKSLTISVFDLCIRILL